MTVFYPPEVSSFLGLTDVDETTFVGAGTYFVQVKATEDGLKFTAGTGSVAWGSITGTLTDQTDLDTRFNTIEDKVIYYEIFENTAATSGTVTKPTGSTILLNRYEAAGDCLIVEIDANNRPVDEPARESDGTIITSTLDVSGNYSLSGTPNSATVAIVYQISIKLVDSGNVNINQIVNSFEIYDADKLPYDNTSSGLTATNVQDAIDEIDSDLDTVQGAFVNKDGTTALTANWDVGSFKITARQLESNVTTGTAPLVVASTTLVDNLNADLLDGVELSAIVQKSLFDAHTILYATVDDTPAALTVAEQTIVGRLTGGNISAITIGIADNNILQVDGTPNDNEYARFTANGIEGRTTAELISDVGDAAADGSTKGFSTFTANDFDAASGVVSIDYANGQKATTAQPGFITELATDTETTTGTDATRAVTPDGLAGSDYGKRIVTLVLLDDDTDTSVKDGIGDITFTVPIEMNGWNLVAVAASVEVAGTTNTTDIQVRNVTQAADMLTTKITIDSSELTSYTAATAPVIDTANDDVATGDKIRIDCDAISTTAAKGLQVKLTFQLP